MTHAAPGRPSLSGDWAVFHCGELVACPAPRTTRDGHTVTCGEKDLIGRVRGGTIVAVRTGAVTTDLAGTDRRCPRCKTMLSVVVLPELSVLTP